MPYGERLSEVNKQISEWLKSLERPFNYQTDMLRLRKFERNNMEYIYKYEILRNKKNIKNFNMD